ncbi:MAG: glycosyltransferase [Cyanobacteria bacterium P01_D01_bin.1]
MHRISVLTLTRDRDSHLHNLLEGLSRSSQLPDECVVVHMNEPAERPTNWPFACHHYRFDSKEDRLPLAKARNFAAKKAKGDLLLFLDVDCIPGTSLIEAYSKACQQVPGAIAMGAVQYLQKAVDIDWQDPATESFLRSQSEPNPKRDISDLESLSTEPNYGLFWSLSFALYRSVFDQLGGFSDCYPGYGAEDTDLAWKARAQDVPLVWVPEAIAYHQYHHSTVPPWHNFDSIVHNAKVFYCRWHEWPMGAWLKVFADEGYIRWSQAGDWLEVVRSPSA